MNEKLLWDELVFSLNNNNNNVYVLIERISIPNALYIDKKKKENKRNLCLGDIIHGYTLKY